MVVAFANNLTLVAVGNTTVTVDTDPVPLGNNDRLACMLNVHYIQKTAGTSLTLTYKAQISNDGGQNYADSTTVTESATAPGVLPKVGTVNGALVRFRYTLALVTGSAADVGACTFDLHVNFDHA